MTNKETEFQYGADFDGTERTHQGFKYRVWHIPQIGVEKAFYVYTNDLYEAYRIADALAMYDSYEFNHNVKGDYSNMNGVEEWDADDNEWYSHDSEYIGD